MGKDGNKPTCVRGEPSDQPPNSPEPFPQDGKNKGKLVRIGSRYFSKDVTTTRRLNWGFELGKSPSGVRFKSLNELVSEKEREYKPVNKKLPACPGEAVRSPTPIPEEEKEE